MDDDRKTQWRDLHLLYVHRDTLHCALTRCVACCYKIVLYSRPGLLPNVRPEMCPRMATKAKTEGSKDAAKGCIGLYDATQVKRIMTVGDGNFSYSVALARALGPDSGVHLVATSHESKTTVVETYPDGEKILDELNAMDHVTVHHEVDATDAEQMQTLGPFDRIIWNFPCVRAPRGEDGQNEEMERNKKLLHDFFSHVGRMLTSSGEVHVTHKTKAPFGQWGIENLAKTNKLCHKQSVIFDRCLYPGYTNKKVLSKGSFPIWDSQTFVFVPEERMQVPSEDEGATTKHDEGTSDIIEKVTMDILKKVYLLLAPSLDDIFCSKKKKRRIGSTKEIVNSSHFSDVINKKRKQPTSDRSKGSKQAGKKKGRRS